MLRVYSRERGVPGPKIFVHHTHRMNPLESTAVCKYTSYRVVAEVCIMGKSVLSLALAMIGT